MGAWRYGGRHSPHENVEEEDPKPECPGISGMQRGVTEWVQAVCSVSCHALIPSETWSPGTVACEQGLRVRDHAQEIALHSWEMARGE